jgi:hypothetical protein
MMLSSYIIFMPILLIEKLRYIVAILLSIVEMVERGLNPGSLSQECSEELHH